ncbi:hypothetical protein [Bacillus xiapuensis]|uniref:hypothetical protein n=1 Tax=Bacillus xiapuensis TaxID=2014075 RepID=UPI0018E22054|nr:hypothetical protein [Bacillus xiapuensis]
MGNNYCHKHHKDKEDHKRRASFADFEFYTLTPNVSVDNRFELPVNTETTVASVTVEQVKAGDLVWLNGVFGLDNDDNDPREIEMRVYKGTPPVIIPGQEIYLARIDIDGENDGDQIVAPLAHVDEIAENDRNVTYTVTVRPDGDEVYLNGPVTLTAALIKR